MRNYAIIAENIDRLMIKSYESEDKALVKSILKEVKSNKNLQLLYTIISNLSEGYCDQSNVEEYINENIKAAKDINKKSLNTLLEACDKSESSDLIDSINTILFENKNVYNMKKYNQAYDCVKNHLIDRKNQKMEFQQKLEEYDSTYKSLDEQDKLLFESYLKSDDEGRKTLFENQKSECLNILDQYIQNENDLQTKISLYETKDLVYNLSSDSDEFVSHLTKLNELKKELL